MSTILWQPVTSGTGRIVGVASYSYTKAKKWSLFLKAGEGVLVCLKQKRLLIIFNQVSWKLYVN